MRYAHNSEEDTTCKRNMGGRPENIEQREAFEKTSKYFETHDSEQFTISELVKTMEKFLESSTEYTNKYFKQKLIEYFGNDSIVICSEDGNTDIVTLKTSADSILRKCYQAPKDVNIHHQKILLLTAAAKLIKADIKSVITDTDQYPSLDKLDIDNAISFLPSSLYLFLHNLIVQENDLKAAAIGQAIMQASCPRKIISPLQVGLGVQLHHHYRSRHLVDVLNRLGFCSSYNEILKFERNACKSASKTIESNICQESVLHFVADNADHSTCTLNGDNTMHGMGIIAALTNGKFQYDMIERKKVPNSEINSLAKINISIYSEKNSISSLKFKLLGNSANIILNSEDFLWQQSSLLKDPIPSWSGTMQLINNNEGSDTKCKTPVTFLPIIDLSPSDMNCIYSTLKFVSEIACKVKKPIEITFDQPLFWKASKIIYSSTDRNIKEIIVTLGTFHTVMNLLGANGTIMRNTGLRNILDTIYNDISVVHILGGKAVSRALRAHFIVDQCLSILTAEKTECFKDDQSIPLLQEMYYDLKQGKVNIENNAKNEDLLNLKSHFVTVREELSSNSRTAALWILYQDLVRVSFQPID